MNDAHTSNQRLHSNTHDANQQIVSPQALVPVDINIELLNKCYRYEHSKQLDFNVNSR